MNKLKIIPLHARVVVKRKEADKVSKGGIIIPDNAKETPLLGTVMAVGAGTKDHKMTVKVSDVVHFNKHAGSDIEVDGETYTILQETDILMIE